MCSMSEISLRVVWDAVNVITVIQTSKEIRSPTRESRPCRRRRSPTSVTWRFPGRRLWPPRRLPLSQPLQVHTGEAHQIEYNLIWILSCSDSDCSTIKIIPIVWSTSVDGS